MKYFGTDGIRGHVNSKNINGDMFFKFGLAAGKYFTNLKKKKQTAIIAKDTRLSGYMLEAALQAGFIAAGVNVRLLGPIPTPGVAYLTKTLRNQFGVVISASHNDFLDNGIKIFNSDGEKISRDIEKRIENHLAGDLLSERVKGSPLFVLIITCSSSKTIPNKGKERIPCTSSIDNIS